MIHGRVPGVEKPVARVVQGTVMIGTGEEAKSFALLDEVFELGGTTFDTAHQYNGGDSERVFSRWVRERGLRDEVVVVGKGAHHSEDRDRVTPYDITADPARRAGSPPSASPTGRWSAVVGGSSVWLVTDLESSASRCQAVIDRVENSGWTRPGYGGI